MTRIPEAEPRSVVPVARVGAGLGGGGGEGQQQEGFGSGFGDGFGARPAGAYARGTHDEVGHPGPCDGPCGHGGDEARPHEPAVHPGRLRTGVRDAQLWDTYVFLAVAAFVVWPNRRAIFTCDGAVTRVLIPGEVPPPDAVPGALDLRPSAR